jgi:hypothetical protein
MMNPQPSQKTFRVIYQTGGWLDTAAQNEAEARRTAGTRARGLPQLEGAIQSVIEMPEKAAVVAD